MAFKYKSLLAGNAPKIRPIIAILFTTLLSVLLVWQRTQTSRGAFRDAVMNNPGTTSFVKQLIASLLGALWIYVAGSIFNLTTRLRLMGDRKPTLQTLNVWMALGLQRIDFNLPIYYTSLTAVVLLAGHSIGALWAGAISPLPTIADVQSTVFVPVFNEDPPWMVQEFPSLVPSAFDDKESICKTENGINGFIPTCPVPGLQNFILSSASLATTWNGRPRTHAKNDNPTWTYSGRSYGVGSSQGLVNLPGFGDEGGEVLAYNYTEAGYLTSSTCHIDSNAQFQLQKPLPVDIVPNYNLSLTIYAAYGSLPNSDGPLSFPVLLTNLTSTPAILTWAASGANSQNTLSIAATGYYLPYNSTICTVTWTPTIFSVGVNFTNQTIYVKPLYSLPDASSFDENEYLRTNAMNSLSILAQTSASASYASLGQSLVNNWKTYYQYTQFQLYGDAFNTNVSFTGNGTTQFLNTSPLPALQDSVNAMLDDIITGFGAAQLSWGFDGNGTGSADVISHFSAIRLGEDKYIILTLAINIILLIIAIEEVIRTHNWHGISLFDYQDIKSLVIAASAGGTEVAEECRRKHKPGTTWEGDGDSKEAASIRVRLLHGDADGERGPVIVLADDEPGQPDDGKLDGSEAENGHASLKSRLFGHHHGDEFS